MFNWLIIDCPLSSKTHPVADSYLTSILYAAVFLFVQIILVLFKVYLVFRPEELGISCRLSLWCPLC